MAKKRQTAKNDSSKRTIAILLIIAIALSVVGVFMAMREEADTISVGQGKIQAYVLEKDSDSAVASAQVTAQVVKRTKQVIIQ